MTLTKEQQKALLAVLLLGIVLVNGYRFLAVEAPKVVPLVYERGAIADSPVRHGLQSRSGEADPLAVYLNLSKQSYPGVLRDLFRMENPRAAKLKPAPVVVVSAPPAPAGPVKTPEEIAAELARAELLKFRYLGYVIEKDMTVFLSKEGELFVVKVGDNVLSGYTVREANKDFAVIQDTPTRVEGRVPLSGSGGGVTQLQQQPLSQQQAPYIRQQQQQPMTYPTRPQAMQPVQPFQPQDERSIKKSNEQSRLQQRRQRIISADEPSD